MCFHEKNGRHDKSHSTISNLMMYISVSSVSECVLSFMTTHVHTYMYRHIYIWIVCIPAVVVEEGILFIHHEKACCCRRSIIVPSCSVSWFCPCWYGCVIRILRVCVVFSFDFDPLSSWRVIKEDSGTVHQKRHWPFYCRVFHAMGMISFLTCEPFLRLNTSWYCAWLIENNLQVSWIELRYLVMRTQF